MIETLVEILTTLSATLFSLIFSLIIPYGSFILIALGFMLLIFYDKFEITRRILSNKESRVTFFILLIFVSLFVLIRAEYGLKLAKYELKLSPMIHATAGYFIVLASIELFKEKMGLIKSVVVGVVLAFSVATLNETIDYFSHAGFSIEDIGWWIPGVGLKSFVRLYKVRTSYQKYAEFKEFIEE